MWSMFEDELKKIDTQLGKIQKPDIPDLFRHIPFDNFGELLFDAPAQYPNVKALLPSMVPEEDQKMWTGWSGKILLDQSLVFVKTMITGYSAITGKKIGDASVLDFGCGWGRLLRLFSKYVPVDNLYGVDPMEKSIQLCKKHGVKGNLAVSDWVPASLPFDKKFDLIFAFSVFTHLSENTTRVVLSTLRNYISDNGVLLITVRPAEFWNNLTRDTALASKMIKLHNEVGYSFIPHKNTKPINGDITYGNTSMTLAYIEKNFPQWKIVSIECNELTKYQVLVFLTPVSPA
jgi:2-polyprenyl-3-methyl-5-hydroxy-6-metoxy-1,4-benzoquinol methylase